LTCRSGRSAWSDRDLWRPLHRTPLGYTKVLSSGSTVQIASTPHDPSMRTVHTPPGLSADRPGDEKATSQVPVTIRINSRKTYRLHLQMLDDGWLAKSEDYQSGVRGNKGPEFTAKAIRKCSTDVGAVMSHAEPRVLDRGLSPEWTQAGSNIRLHLSPALRSAANCHSLCAGSL
jgi:hypothetical protein